MPYLAPAFRASGNADVTWKSDKDLYVDLTVTDKYADGHSVGIRLRTEETNGDVHNWPWHKNAEGSGKTVSFGAPATDTKGMTKANAEVGVFEGSDLLAYCYTGVVNNPYA